MISDRRSREGDFPATQLVLAWLLVCAILFIAGSGRVFAGQFPDPDDALRLVQVRDLLGGQSWFDVTQFRIAPPEGTPMHWSRLVDAPLALMIAVLTPLLGQATAETLAMIAVPFLTFAIAAAAIARLAWRLLGSRAAIFAVLACGFLPALLFQFMPKRIDHHGWQVVSVALALLAIHGRNARLGGWWSGVAMAFGLSISIEILPMAGAFGGVLFLRWWLDYRERVWLAAYMQGLSLGLVGFYLLTRGLSPSVFCDAIGPGHLAFFGVAALGTTMLAALPRFSRFALIALFTVLAALSLGAFALVSPGCFATPFAGLDPVVDHFWYRLVYEGQPLWLQAPTIYVPALVQMAAAIGATMVLRTQAHDWLRRWWTEHLLLLLAALALSLMVARSLAFASIIAAIPLGSLAANLLTRLRKSGAVAMQLGAALAILVLLAPNAFVMGARQLVPWKEVPSQAPARNLADAQCDIYTEVAKLAALHTGTIFAPLEIGPAVLLETEHSVIATGHHRAADAMRDVIHAFMGSPDDARVIAKQRGADYIALCTDMAEANLYAHEAPEGLSARLLGGNVPDWLEPLDVDAPPQLLVYRVRD